MPRAYCLVVLSAAMAVNGLAAPEITAPAVIAQRDENCPYLSVSHTDSTTSIQGCCVGGSDAGQQPFLSVCEGWPICGSNPTTTTWTATPISCAAMIAYTDANYDEELSSAEKAFSADSTDFCYTVGGADNCAGGLAAPATATTTREASSATTDSGDSDVAATGGNAAATGGNAVGSAGTAGSAVNSSNGASNTGTSESGSSGSSSSSSDTGSSSSGSSSSSSTTTTTTTTTTTASGTSGANALALGLGWGAWTLGLAGVGPVVMAVML